LSFYTTIGAYREYSPFSVDSKLFVRDVEQSIATIIWKFPGTIAAITFEERSEAVANGRRATTTTVRIRSLR